jgi:hypothetical protein
VSSVFDGARSPCFAYRGTRDLRSVQVLLGHAVPPELNEGTTPSTIARKVGVGYATVMRIAENQRRWKVASNGVPAE